MEEQVIKLIKKALNLDEGFVLDKNSSAQTVELWDSFGQIVIVQALEEHFQITFDFDEIVQLESVKGICNILERKLG